MRVIVIGADSEWCYYSWEYYRNTANNFLYKNMKTMFKNKVSTYAFRFHYSLEVNERIKLPLKSIWYKKVCKSIGVTNNSLIIFYDWNPLAFDLKFQNFLKKNYPGIKTAYLFSNIVKQSGANKCGFLQELKNNFDYVIAFDSKDAENYGFYYHPLIFKLNRNTTPIDSEYTYDLCFCGKAKTDNRLNQIHAVYKQAVKEGLKVWFLIHGVDSSKQLNNSNIIYNETIHFNDLLAIIQKSKCIVDITQDDSNALPLNIVQSIVLDKKLITNNTTIKKYEFYSNSNILLTSENESFSDFLNRPFVQYNKDYCEMFTLETLLKELNMDY